jgi:hypothetical protein
MKARELEKWLSRLHSRAPLLGGWLRWRAVRALAREGWLEAVRAIVEAWEQNLAGPKLAGDCWLFAGVLTRKSSLRPGWNCALGESGSD